MKEIVKIVVLSHKRADNVDTVNILPPGSFVLCVPESQAQDYHDNYPHVELLVHPDTVVGLSAKIKWVYEAFPNVAMVDDDINAIRRTYIDKSFNLAPDLSPEEAYELIQSTAFTTREAGAKLFGYSTSGKPVTYAACKPFKVSGFVIGGCFGLLEGFKMVLPDNCVSACDYFISGINAFYHRYCWVDTRFAFTSKEGTFQSTGGTADYRSLQTERRDLEMLFDYFGDAISVKKTTAARGSLQHQYERILRVPW